MSRALLAAALFACLALGSCKPWVYDTVTAVAIKPQYMTTIKKFVGTEACAVDDTIFLADFSTCNFSFVEDIVDEAKTISPISCDQTCAEQWGVVSAACYHQFRERMEDDRRFGTQAAEFFNKCDAKAKVHTGDATSTGGATAGGSSTGGSSTGGSSTGGSSTGGSVSATDIDSTTAPAPAEQTAESPAPADEGAASPEPDTVMSPDLAPEVSPEPVASPPMADAEASAEAPSSDMAPGPAPAMAPSPAPAPVPAPAPAPVASGASANSVAAAAFALLGAVLLLL
ncbi:hypothetical protein ABPG75_008075 [Micractinium tetrahymenae]